MILTYKERINRIRLVYPNAYKKWSEADDELLKQACQNSVNIGELSRLFQRQPGAIRSRIKKLDIKKQITAPMASNSLEKSNLWISGDFLFNWIKVKFKPGKEYLFPFPISDYMRENYTKPVIYRWTVCHFYKDEILCAYIGTTKQLVPDRLAGYLNPRNSKTDIRLNREFRNYFEQGFKIKLEILLIEEIKLNDVKVEINDLHSQTNRYFIESLLISYYRQIGVSLLNL